MKKSFTRIMAALALLVFMAPSMVAWGQTQYMLTIDASDFNTTSYAANNGEHTKNAVKVGETSTTMAVTWVSNQVMKSGENMQWQKNNGYIYNHTDLGTINSVTVTSSAGTFTTYYGTSEHPTSITTVGDGFFTTKVGSATGTTSKVEIVFTISGTPLAPCDLALTDAPVELTFDLYNNSTAKTISYTTSSTGEISVAQNDYITATIDQQNKTITVTPIAVTNGVRTIRVNQAADEDYASGYVEFTVNIEDSTPFTGGDVTFNAAVDKGTNSSGSGSITKSGVTFACTSCNLSDGVAYRLYSGSTTTISTTYGTITSIAFTMADGYASTLLSTTTGTYSNGTWTGNAESVSFSASAQARVTEIIVTVAAPATIATPTFDPEGGIFISAQNVEISCETQGVSIYYTTNGSDPDEASTLYNGAITINTTTTLKAIAIKDGESSYVGEATYTFPAVSTIADAHGLNNNEYALVQGVVTFIDNRNIYVQDATAGICLYLNSETVPSTLALGDMVKAYGKKTTYSGLIELTGIDGSNANVFAVVSNGNELPLATKTIEEINTGAADALQSTRVKIVGATIGTIDTNGDTPLTQGTNTINIYKIPTLTDINANDNVDVIGVIGYHDAAQIRVASADDVVKVTLQSFELEIEAENGTVAVFIGEEEQTGTSGSYQIPQGSAVTLTPTPAEGYRFKEWVAEAEEGTVTITNNQFTMPACYVLIQAVFEAVPSWVYTYSINGTEEDYTEVEEGTTITLASSNDLNDGFAFVGWTIDPNDVTGVYTAGSPYVVISDVEFYAVYAHTTGEVSTSKEDASYVKVTSTSDITDGDYLIVYEDDFESAAFNGGLETLDAGHNTIVVEITDGVIASNSTTDAAIFTIDLTNGTLKSASGKYIGVTSNNNGLNQSEDADRFKNTFAVEDGSAKIKADYTGSIMSLRFNATSGDNNYRFRYYKNEGQQPIQLYKYTAGGTPTPQPTTAYYTRVFLNETPNANITIVGPSIIPSGSLLNMESNTKSLTNNLGANSLIIEDGGQYIGNSVEATMQKNIKACEYNSENSEGYYLIASPIFDELNAANVNGLLTEQYDLYKYDNQEDLEWRNYKANEFTTIDPEVGYLYASGSNTTIEFAGELTEMSTSGMYDVTIPNAGFNLIGNPLPYNVALVNEDFEAIDYMILNTNGGSFENSSEAIAPCNAILIQTTNNGETVYFVDPSLLEDYKAININLGENGKQIDNVRVRFGEGRGMNKFYLNENNSRIYFQQGNEEKAVTYSNAQGEMPVSFKAAENGTYTLSFEAENTEMRYMHLIDNMTGNDIDLLATPSYSFEAKTTDYANRFRIVFNANNGVEEMNEDSFAFFNGSEWVVNSEGEATLQVIDMMGRVVSSQIVNGNANVNINDAKGVYVIRLIQNDLVKTQKIVKE